MYCPPPSPSVDSSGCFKAIYFSLMKLPQNDLKSNLRKLFKMSKIQEETFFKMRLSTKITLCKFISNSHFSLIGTYRDCRRTPWIFPSMNSERLNNLSLKYQVCTIMLQRWENLSFWQRLVFNLCEETISRTDEGQPRPKYIFNKCGTNIYFFSLQRFGPSPSLNFKRLILPRL